jgi:hypothetical protein
MEDDPELTIFLAGYEKEMADFLSSNSGLESRIAWRFNIEDYSPAELCMIFDQQVWEAGRKLTPEAMATAALLFSQAWATRRRDYGNGRFVRNVFERTLVLLGRRMRGKGSVDNLRTITHVDIPVSEYAPAIEPLKIDLRAYPKT